MTALCRDCSHEFAELASDLGCPECSSSRVARHPELGRLNIAHVDCDAFFAAVEKRDDPALVERPVIVGGGRRGVVMACCYVARRSGIRSAMPMFKALKNCLDAVVIRPNMEKYRAVSRELRDLMLGLTPLVEPLSIDEAFLDLSGTETLHRGNPARTLTVLARRVERDIGITISIGLSYNKFLAKIASTLDKPRGLAVIGRTEAVAFLKHGVGDHGRVDRRLAAVPVSQELRGSVNVDFRDRHLFALRHPTARALTSEQNHRSPNAGAILVRSYHRPPGTW